MDNIDKEVRKMTMIPYEPWKLMSQLRDELSRFPVFGSEIGRGAVATSDWSPAVDIAEEKDAYIIHADLPGVKPEDIDVSMENGVLTIRGERKDEKSVDQEGYKLVERVQGTFYRRFSLPDSADPDHITAKAEHGVLVIRIPKHEKARTHRIEVQREAA